jgi:SAM-dependent methyltransferase
MPIRNLIRNLLPPALYARALFARDIARTIARSGGMSKRECNICGYKGHFLGFGSPLRYDALCRRCSSAERHRLQILYLERHPEMVKGRDVLHFAPEASINKFVAQRAKSYTGADIAPRRGYIKLNIEGLDLDSNSYDVVICNHVLEHVDDQKALSEIYRVLRPGGHAFLMTPVIEGWEQTYENLTVTSSTDRELHFGQDDHVRYFGRDFRDRVRRAGFGLTEFTATEPDVARYGLVRGE